MERCSGAGILNPSQSVLHHRIRQIISSHSARWKMRGQQGADLFNAIQNRFRKVAMLKARLHHRNDFVPEIVSASGVHPGITDHRKLMRDWSNENQYRISQWRPPHFQLREAMISRLERMVDFTPADIDAYFTARSFLGCGNRRHNSVAVNSLEEMMRFHAESLWELPTAARTATAAVSSATGESTVSTPATTAPTAAATNPPDPSGSA
jgi:hypothetical protein